MGTEQKTHIKKGLIIGLILILFDITLQLTHNKFQPWVANINIAILLIGVIVLMNIQPPKTEGKIVFSNLFGYGFRVSVVAVCALFIYSVLSVYLVFPDYLTELYNHNLVEARKQPNFDAAKVAANKDMAMKVMRTSLLSMVVMFNLAIGITGALVGAVIALLSESFSKKKV